MKNISEETGKIQNSPSQKTLTTEQFLSSYSNRKTRSNYQLAIERYIQIIFILAGSENQEQEQTVLCEHYIEELTCGNRNYYLDLKTYGQTLTETYSPTTANLYLRCVCLWLEECGFSLTKRERQRLTAQLPPPKPKKCELELKRKTFRLIYDSLPLRMGTLLLVLLASGMRLGEALLLKKTDINWEEERTEISIPAEITKTKTARTTYLTEEASEALLKYLRTRTDTDERIFPFSTDITQYHLRATVKRLGLSRTVNGKTYTVHWHMTRKWFISRFSLAANKDVAEHIAGHEGYLSSSYRRYTKKQILKEYIKAEKKLSIIKDSD